MSKRQGRTRPKLSKSRGYEIALSAPIYSLKRRTKLLAKHKQIPLFKALNTIARTEGYNTWSLLIASDRSVDTTAEILDWLQPGELVHLGARPGHGKTITGIDLIAKAIKSGKNGWFFSLEWNREDLVDALRLSTLPTVYFCTNSA